ncbi:MAG: hypothetical protein KAH77_02600 [Thiomargarita sp.]|nr:hypothetical protein [Thiomargarita sp.]
MNRKVLNFDTEIKTNVHNMLLQQQKMTANGERGTALSEVVQQLEHTIVIHKIGHRRDIYKR